jgi:hypothetical protein
MRFLCFLSYLIGFRRILLLTLILMAIAIVQQHASEIRQFAASIRSTPALQRHPPCSSTPRFGVP